MPLDSKEQNTVNQKYEFALCFEFSEFYNVFMLQIWIMQPDMARLGDTVHTLFVLKFETLYCIIFNRKGPSFEIVSFDI